MSWSQRWWAPPTSVDKTTKMDDLAAAAATEHCSSGTEDFERPPWMDWEDPARSWLDLVLAAHSNNHVSVKIMIEMAKNSFWTHGEWDRVIGADDDSDDDDWQQPDDGFGDAQDE